MTIGESIRKQRKLARLTQKELADKCGCATGTIQQYELGKRQPSLEKLCIIANALNITPKILLEGLDLSEIHSDFQAMYNRLEKRRLQYLQSLGYEIHLNPDSSFELYCDGYKYSIPPKEPEEYYDLICEVIDSAARNIIEKIIKDYKNTEEEY